MSIKNRILNFIRDNYKPDSLDIIKHFKLQEDITMSLIIELIDENKINRKFLGDIAWYEVNKKNLYEKN